MEQTGRWHLHFNPRSLAGATVFVLSRKLFSQISIHAPLRERRLGQESLNKRPFISIHAPLRERPGMVWFIQAKQGHFNPRSLAGATIGGSDIACIMGLFQSTLPYGSDLTFSGLLTGNRYFNPRSLTGATFLLSGLSIQSKFQSTLLYGSDRMQAARPAP